MTTCHGTWWPDLQWAAKSNGIFQLFTICKSVRNQCSFYRFYLLSHTRVIKKQWTQNMLIDVSAWPTTSSLESLLVKFTILKKLNLPRRELVEPGYVSKICYLQRPCSQLPKTLMKGFKLQDRYVEPAHLCRSMLVLINFTKNNLDQWSISKQDEKLTIQVAPVLPNQYCL
jgi:hypothetical protein